MTTKRSTVTEARRARLVALVRAGPVTVTTAAAALGTKVETLAKDRKALVARGVLQETLQGRTVTLSIRAKRGRPADVARPAVYVERPAARDQAAACRASREEPYVAARLASQEERRARELAEGNAAPSQRTADQDTTCVPRDMTTLVTVGPYGEVRALKPAEGRGDDLGLVTEPGTDEGVYEGGE